MTKPSSTVSKSMSGMDTYTGSDAHMKTIMRPAHMNTSPWAKLMRRRMP